MPSDWTTTSLGDCADMFSGGTPRKSNRAYWGGTIPWFSAKDLKSFYLSESEDHVTEEAAEAGSRVVPAGTILLLVRGMTLHNDVPIGVLTRAATFNQDIKALRARSGVKQSFLAHWLVSQKPRLLSSVHAAGHGTGVLATDRLRALQVELPPPDEQAAIAEVFDLIEGKIEQNRRTARALERFARAAYTAWFIDFEPVKAKAAGAEGFPDTPAEAFAALPDRFVDSAIGPVPEGWSIASLPQLATFLNGLALQKYPARGDGSDLPVIKIAELRKGSSDNADAANNDVPVQFVVNDGDLLFSWSGTLEVRRWFGGKGALNQHLFKVTPSRHPLWYVHHAILQHLPEFRAIASSKATTMGHIQRRHLDAAVVAVPPEGVLRTVDQLIGPIYDLTASVRFEHRALAALRDYLLPRLLTGEVRLQPPVGTNGP